MFFSQFSGVDGVLTYASDRFRDHRHRYELMSNLPVVVLYAVQLAAALICFATIDRKGRRSLLLVSAAAAAAALLALGLYLLFEDIGMKSSLHWKGSWISNFPFSSRRSGSGIALDPYGLCHRLLWGLCSWVGPNTVGCTRRVLAPEEPRSSSWHCSNLLLGPINYNHGQFWRHAKRNVPVRHVLVLHHLLRLWLPFRPPGLAGFAVRCHYGTDSTLLPGQSTGSRTEEAEQEPDSRGSLVIQFTLTYMTLSRLKRM